MANYMTTDKGDTVLAIGAPGSPMRCKFEHPLKIETIDEMYQDGAELQEAIDYLIGLGITSKLEQNSILYNTMFKEQL